MPAANEGCRMKNPAHPGIDQALFVSIEILVRMQNSYDIAPGQN
jgi:hypothetical protein